MGVDDMWRLSFRSRPWSCSDPDSDHNSGPTMTRRLGWGRCVVWYNTYKITTCSERTELQESKFTAPYGSYPGQRPNSCNVLNLYQIRNLKSYCRSVLVF